MSKKMIYLKIIIVSLCLLALTGCSFTKKDNSFIIDVVNDETNMKAELSTWNEGYFENKTKYVHSGNLCMYSVRQHYRLC